VAGALPETTALPRHSQCGNNRPRSSGSNPVAELGTSFDGVWRGFASCGRISKSHAFRVGRAHSIFRRVRMSWLFCTLKVVRHKA
jgi:hypothetical protein